MKYLKLFNKDVDYQQYINGEGVELPNVSLCKDVDIVYFNPLTSTNKIKGIIEVDDINKNYAIHSLYNTMPIDEGMKGIVDIDEILEMGVKIEEIKSVKIDGVETEIFVNENTDGPTDMICCKINTIGEHIIEIEYEKEFNDRIGLFLSCDFKSIDCGELKVNNLNSMFYFLMVLSSEGFGDYSIKPEIKGLENIDTSNVVTMYSMMYESPVSSITGIENWNTSNVKYAAYAFFHARFLTTLDLTNWDLSNVADAQVMFSGCESLIELKMGGPINKNMIVEGMFNDVETNGAFYYNSIYDYSKIIAVLPSTWTAIPCTLIDGTLVPNNN